MRGITYTVDDAEQKIVLSRDKIEGADGEEYSELNFTVKYPAVCEPIDEDIVEMMIR